ncbi:MAG: FAD-dependent thymidylate synthase [Candidatus Pacebacteria bacterium]|jgi:thymidylate synthase ThyX|nr:FAD-dependent thymidylate synthase [Candidatus Paceibacterota bacterium]
MLSTKDIKVKFLGITPRCRDETGELTPQQIVALSGLLTYSGKSIDAILKETQESGKDLNKKIALVLRKSSLKGHASMATTPVLSFSYEASKFIDSGVTGMVFASAIMASGRRTDTTNADIVYPAAIERMKEAAEIYRVASEKNIEVLNHLLANGVGKDEASKVLQYGIYGTGIIQLPIESLVTLKREYEAEKEWMPEDIGLLIEAIERKLKDYGVDLLYSTRVAAPRNTYPYPNIFKDPAETNFAREAAAEDRGSDNFKILASEFISTPGLEKRLRDLRDHIEQAAKNKNEIKSVWMKLLAERQQIARDYMMSASVKVYSAVAWRVWGDKKRHRTVPMVVDSVYHSAKVAAGLFEKYKEAIKERKLAHAMIDDIDRVFSMPPAICKDNEFLYQYLQRALESLETYEKLLKMGIKEKDAIFVIPRGLKLSVVQDYNFYNLIAGYYPLRICSTVEEELRRLSLKEVVGIKNLLQQKGLDWLAWHIAPKCHCAGFCLESECCGAIKSLVKDYDDAAHKEIHDDLETKFREVMNNINPI